MSAPDDAPDRTTSDLPKTITSRARASGLPAAAESASGDGVLVLLLLGLLLWIPRWSLLAGTCAAFVAINGFMIGGALNAGFPDLAQRGLLSAAGSGALLLLLGAAIVAARKQGEATKARRQAAEVEAALAAVPRDTLP